MKFTLDDFISLQQVAKKLAAELDDQADLLRTFERCDDAKCSFAIWHRSAIDVWRYEYEHDESSLMPVMGRGDFIDQWQGAFFLTRDCIEQLFNSSGQKLSYTEFYPNENMSSLTQRLTIASSKDIAQVTQKTMESEFLKESGENSIDQLSSHDQALLKNLSASFEDYSNDDGNLTFSIQDLVIPRNDLVKLNLSDLRKVGSKSSFNSDQMPDSQEHSQAWKTIAPLTEQNISAWLQKNICSQPKRMDGDSQAEYLKECFRKLGLEQGDKIDNIIVNVIDSSGLQFGVSKRSIADKRRQLGFKGNSKSQSR